MKSKIFNAFILSVSLSASAVMAAAPPPDSMITAKAKLALWTSDVRSRSVQIDTNDGIVTLSGKVPSQEQKNLAEKKAKQVDGVRSVKSFLQIVPVADEKFVERSDKELKDVAQKALDKEEFADSKIKVKNVSKGVVYLSGDAHTVSDHLRAVALIDRLPGVRRVTSAVKSPDKFTKDDRIEFTRADGPAVKPERSADARSVDKRDLDKRDLDNRDLDNRDLSNRDLDRRDGAPPVAQRSGSSDSGITMAVKMRLLTAAEIPSNEIRVDTEDKIVTLFGIVPSDEVKRAAEAQANRVSGVASVKNELEVVPSNEKERVESKDEDLTSALKLAFKDRKEWKDVKATVKNGVVQLTGRVSSMWEEFSAVRAARQVKGVRNVVDQLEVEHTERDDRSGS